MKIPQGTTETQVLQLIEKILKRIAPKFKFGIFDVEDIQQEGFIIALSAMEHYDSSLSLENYITTCIKNGLVSLKRKHYIRSSTMCNNCADFSEDCTACNRRLKTYISKQNLNNPLDISGVNPDNESSLVEKFDVIDAVETVELQQLVDKNLPIKYREDYLKIKAGVYVNKSIRQEIESIILNIINE